MFGMITRSRGFASSALKVVNNVAMQRFEVTVDEKEAVLGYQQQGDNIVWESVEVPDLCQGKGVGKLLAEYACDHAVSNELKVTCKCHFLANYCKQNSNKYKKLKINYDLED